MKYFIAQIPNFLIQPANRRNTLLVIKFLLLTFFLILLFSTIFHYIMLYENKNHSLITGVYWTLTVMSTLGFGDITFTSDLGKFFSIIVLLSGIFMFMLILPFTFIRFVYQPWIDTYNNRRVPRELNNNFNNHVVLVGENSLALSIAEKFEQYKIYYVILVANAQYALELFDKHYQVVIGELDDAKTYNKVRIKEAALVFALNDDLKNTNIALTAHEVSPETMLGANADSNEAINVLQLAGCDYVFQFTNMLGRNLVRRVHGSRSQSNIIARFGELCIAEAPAVNTKFIGKNIVECGFRKLFGLNVVGIWQGSHYIPPKPETVIESNTVLLLAGSQKEFDKYDLTLEKGKHPSLGPVLILGGGRVGLAAARALEEENTPFYLVEKSSKYMPSKDFRYIVGNAEDVDVLYKAHIMNTRSVVVTTHNDDLNIYLTIFCRKLRPDVQIISRATLDRNVTSLYNAGANLVMSHSSIAATTIINLLMPGRLTLLTEGINLFCVFVSERLIGKNLLESQIREKTDCTVVAFRNKEALTVTPDPIKKFKHGDELIMIGTEEAELKFMDIFAG